MNNSLFGINSSFRHANICPLPNFIDNCTVWTQPRSQWIITTTGTILLSLIIMFANIYNLVVFRLWSHKNHTCSFTSSSPWKQSSVNVAVISVDRWLSVEFPIPYRNHSNRRRILWTISVAYVIATLHTVVPLVVFPECLLLYCSRQQAFRWLGRSYLLWNYTRGPLFLMIIILTQTRICVIASGARLRILRSRRVARALDERSSGIKEQRSKCRGSIQQARMVVRTIWESVLPGSIMVMGALVANLPYYVVEILGVGESGSPAVMFTVIVFSTQHIQTPFIYTMFFRPYREAAHRLWRCGRAMIRQSGDLAGGNNGIGRPSDGTLKRYSQGPPKVPTFVEPSVTVETEKRRTFAEPIF
ncbi:hypothetical protein BV898_06135 [Hypsibius exemplaris]|uniref:G-protein coupled receptors family 1 profile domain-containing protein n=1 Tax=Hypsibius exemplaris TaxID=2072580 RepID=A0A1W0WXE0_HYPEX|nr:hypothetical protein BV898_06135 [Hypsibius exemplaris]